MELVEIERLVLLVETDVELEVEDVLVERDVEVLEVEVDFEVLVEEVLVEREVLEVEMEVLVELVDIEVEDDVEVVVAAPASLNVATPQAQNIKPDPNVAVCAATATWFLSSIAVALLAPPTAVVERLL